MVRAVPADGRTRSRHAQRRKVGEEVPETLPGVG